MVLLGREPVYVHPMLTRKAFGLWIALAFTACGSSRSTFANYPGAPPTFERVAGNQAIEVSDKVIAAAGGAANWDKAKQVRWTQTKVENGQQITGEVAWDRWNARHWARVPTPEGNAIVTYELYGDFATSYIESNKTNKKTFIEGRELGLAVGVLRNAFIQDVTVTFMPFLMQEPGTKLEYVGLQKKDDKEYHDIKVTFGDSWRKELNYHAIVDKETNMIHRVDIEKGVEKIGFELADWTEAGGIKIPATRKNIGSGEVNSSKDFKVGAPDDELYMKPLT